MACAPGVGARRLPVRLLGGGGARAMARGGLPAARAAAPASGAPNREAAGVWGAADAVCFDVDSTVCVDEGIDELAAALGKGEEVAAWTVKAMTGGVPFEEALAARLAIIDPTAAKVERFLAANPPRLSPGMAELASRLQGRGTAVYLVSGGFRQMIAPVAELLGVPAGNVYANEILFAADGSYAGFNDREFTSRQGGKAEAIKHLKAEHGYRTVVMVGDGMTDLEARQPGGASLFIGYGGNVVRETVAARAVRAAGGGGRSRAGRVTGLTWATGPTMTGLVRGQLRAADSRAGGVTA